MKDLILVVIGAVVVCSVIYGMYWIGKTVSYSFFYETMVKESITEMVKPSCLK